MPSKKPDNSNPLKLGILLRWLSANESTSFTANIKWFDWITTNLKPGDTIETTEAISKLGEFEDELNKMSPNKQNICQRRHITKSNITPVGYV